MLDSNTLAPDFSVINHEGTEISLSDYRGKWVLLYFYPKDNTPGCTQEACALRDNFDALSEAGVVILGVSTDSPESHTAFKEKHALPFDLLADTDKDIVSRYEAQSALGGTKRVSYLINPDGIIARVYAKVKPLEHAQEVLTDIRNLTNTAD